MAYTKEEQERRKITQERIKKEIRDSEIINRIRNTQN